MVSGCPAGYGANRRVERPSAGPGILRPLLLRSPSLDRPDTAGADPDIGQALLAYARVITSTEQFLQLPGMSDRAQQMLRGVPGRTARPSRGAVTQARPLYWTLDLTDD
jgi:hypothetical protein